MFLHGFYFLYWFILVLYTSYYLLFYFLYLSVVIAICCNNKISSPGIKKYFILHMTRSYAHKQTAYLVHFTIYHFNRRITVIGLFIFICMTQWTEEQWEAYRWGLRAFLTHQLHFQTQMHWHNTHTHPHTVNTYCMHWSTVFYSQGEVLLKVAAVPQ